MSVWTSPEMVSPDVSPPRSPEIDVLEDPNLQPFLRDDFNGTEFASQILRDPRQSTPAKSNELQDAAHWLDDAIHLEVTSKQDDLLSHARQLQVSEQALQRIKGSISGLSDAAQRLKRDVRVPFDTVQQQVTQLGNLHNVMETLRLVNHHVKQTAKLRQLVKPGAALEAMDAAKAAKIVWEIEAAAAPATLAGIDIVDRRVPLYLGCTCTDSKRTVVAASKFRASSSCVSWCRDSRFVRECRQRVVRSADELLTSGLATLSQADVAAALQVSFNLGTLRDTVHACVAQQAGTAERSLAKALDAKQLSATAAGAAGAGGGVGGRGAGSVTARAHAALWAALDECMTCVHTAAVATWHLQRVASKKRDPLTLAAFADVVQVCTRHTCCTQPLSIATYSLMMIGSVLTMHPVAMLRCHGNRTTARQMHPSDPLCKCAM